MSKYIIFVLCIMILACSPQKKLRRLIKKHPELKNEVVTVEVVRHDTVIVAPITADSVFSADLDTVYIEKDNLRIRYIRVRDSIYLEGKYLGDTIPRIDTVVVEVPIVVSREPTIWEEVRGWLWLMILIVLGIVFRKALKKLIGF